MPQVNEVAVIDYGLCKRCPFCVRACPTDAISWDRHRHPVVQIDPDRCLDCTICMTRCPNHAITMQARDEPLAFGVDWTRADRGEVSRICHAAHMHEEQIICFCRQTRAREVAAAILLGHRTPEELSVATGIRTGCGVLCITSVLRLLKAAGVEVQKAPGYQWYGTYVTIWDLPAEAFEKYPEYFLKEDLEAAKELYPRGEES